HLSRLFLEHAVHHLRVPQQEPLERGSRQGQAPQGTLGDYVRRRQLAEQARDLPEEIAGPERGAVDPVDADARGAVEDDVEGGARHALADDALALVEPRLVKG